MAEDKGGLEAFSLTIERRSKQEGSEISLERASAFYDSLLRIANQFFDAKSLGDLTTKQYQQIILTYKKGK